MFPDTVRVLLVGLSASNSPELQDHLRRLGCRVSMRKSCRDAARTLQRDGYGLVLAEFLLSDGCAYDLVPVILATETSMFFTNALDDACWWMTAACRGQIRAEECGMNADEFRVALNEIVFDEHFAVRALHPDSWGAGLRLVGKGGLESRYRLAQKLSETNAHTILGGGSTCNE
jgi:hypothetical protein